MFTRPAFCLATRTACSVAFLAETEHKSGECENSHFQLRRKDTATAKVLGGRSQIHITKQASSVFE